MLPETSISPSLSLLDLNADCLGAIYSHLGTREDRMSFFHTCRALHEVLKGKVYKLVLHVGEEGSGIDELEGQESSQTQQEQPLSVDDALRTFPGAVLRSIKLMGSIPREWRSLDGPLQHAEHVTELDVAQPVDYELLDVATLCRLFPSLTSLRVLDKWATMGIESLRPLQHLKHLKQLTLLQPSPSSDDLPENLELILSTCHQLESLTLTFFPQHSREVRLHSRSLRHICITHMHATALCDLCWHLEHDAFPKLQSITIGEALILCDLEHLKGSTVEMKLGTRLCATNLMHVPDAFTVLGSCGSDFGYCRRQGFGVEELPSAFSALLEGGIAQVVRNVSSLCLDHIDLSDTLVSLLGRAFHNVRLLSICANVCGAMSGHIQCVTAFPLLRYLKLDVQAASPFWRNTLSSLINAAQIRESPCGLHILLPDTPVFRQTVDKVVEDRALCGGLDCVRIGFSV